MAASKKTRSVIAWILFCVYMAVAFYLLFFSDRSVQDGYRYNLKPFQEIRRCIRHWDTGSFWGYARKNLLGNIVLFMPFGYFLPKLTNERQRWFTVLLFSLEFSLAVEVLQLAFRLGVFDVDDLILNTLGGYLGYLCHFFAMRFRRKQNVSKKKKT